jgi:hypothetical protein
MRKCLLIMAAFVAVLALSAVSGAGTAGASTTTVFCVAGYNTCFIYGSPSTALDYPANMAIPIASPPSTTYTLHVTGSWTSATSAAAGTYVLCVAGSNTCTEETGNAEPVSDITLGAPEPAGNNQDQYTCLSFTVNATNATVYATEAVDTSAWTAAAGSCMGVTQPTAVTTSLSGNGQSGTSIMVPAGTAVTDTAVLSGTNASTATGTITYNVYSDPACTVAVDVNAGTGESITTPGTLPASTPVTLSTAGTYYWQASYSGDANNGPSTSTCGTAGEVETVASPSCGSAAGGYNVPSSWTTQEVNGLTPGVDPLNVVISSCSNVSLDDIQKGMSGWDSASLCVSPEQANVTGTFAVQQQSWRLDGCQGGGWNLARSGTENHARLWNQPIAGSQYGAWFISASYETACVINARDTMVPVSDTNLNEAQFLVRSALGLGWHCIDGSQGSIGADGYNRAAQDFVAAIQAAKVSQKWDVSVLTIQTPAGPGEGHVTPGGSAAENAIAQFNGTVYVVTVDSATSTP